MKVHQLLEGRSTAYGYTSHEPAEDEQAVCDQILFYLTKAHRALMKMDTDTITVSGKRKLESIYDIWRTSLMHGDFEEWSNAYDKVGERDVDAFDFFIEEVFEQAGLDHESTIDDFLKKCGAHDLKLKKHEGGTGTWGEIIK